MKNKREADATPYRSDSVFFRKQETINFQVQQHKRNAISSCKKVPFPGGWVREAGQPSSLIPLLKGRAVKFFTKFPLERGRAVKGL